MIFHPVLSACKWLAYVCSGKLQFPKQRIGESISGEGGKVFKVFRQVVVEKKLVPKAIFMVQFKLAGMAPETNIKVSALAIPFFVGLPGFLSKCWMLDEKSGYFQGIYEWETEEHAKRYASSFAMKFMCKRALPGSISYTIIKK